MSLANRMDERAIKAERARKQLYKHREALRRKRESALLDADAHSKETQTEQKQPAASPASGPLDKPETASAEDAVPCEAPDTTDIFSADVLEPQKEADTAALFAVDDAASRPEAPSDVPATEPAHFASELWSTDAQTDAFDFEPGVETNMEQLAAPSYSTAEPATGLFDTTVQPQTTTNLYAPFPQRAKSMDNYAESFEASVYERDEDQAGEGVDPYVVGEIRNGGIASHLCEQQIEEVDGDGREVRQDDDGGHDQPPSVHPPDPRTEGTRPPGEGCARVGHRRIELSVPEGDQEHRDESDEEDRRYLLAHL